MQIIILSGGSGSRFWPLSNDSRSKQFLRLLKNPQSGLPESMVQRVVRQIRESGIQSPIIVATNEQQQDSIKTHLGDKVELLTEPERRGTFPAVCLSCEYLSKIKDCPDDEVVVVMPCDQFVELQYYEAVKEMAVLAAVNGVDMVVMGILPDFPSTKFGYILPDENIRKKGECFPVVEFNEKPDRETAKRLMAEGGYWNGGVYAFRLGFLKRFAEKYVKDESFEKIKENYKKYPVTSFDYEVAEKISNIWMVPYGGVWKDLDTWERLLVEVINEEQGTVISAENINTHVLNELQIPILCVGTKDLIVAASPDGILIANKNNTERIREYTKSFRERPMFEERRWGTYQVIDRMKYPDGYETLTKRLTLNPECSISYQQHKFRDETWTFIDGEGEIVINDDRRKIRRGETVHIKKGERHALRAITSLSFIEVQSGSNLVETDIERFPFEW